MPVVRARQKGEAEKMTAAVVATSARFNEPAPPYDFLELIGKGSFGHVFKR